jgi:hypothetical protein
MCPPHAFGCQAWLIPSPFAQKRLARVYFNGFAWLHAPTSNFGVALPRTRSKANALRGAQQSKMSRDDHFILGTPP